jgi:hypothetical protein
MSTPKRILTFDIGIRNLAWCLLEQIGGEQTQWTILGWENFDLLAGTTSQEATQKPVCVHCGKRATHVAGNLVVCKRHTGAAFPILADLSGNPYKTIPTLKCLKTIPGISLRGRREEIVSTLRTKFAIPITPMKKSVKQNSDLGILHTALQNFVNSRLELFRSAGTIFLENQPAFKNPTMKSLQILLFATLRERLPGTTVGFVHASKKTRGAMGGDRGYAERKRVSESRIGEWFRKENVVEKEKWSTFLTTQHKKSDLCDSLCMCLDSFVRTETV